MSKKADKVDAWMPLWIGEYLADTTDLSRDEHGGYLLLLMAYWRRKGPLPDTGRKLANICKASPAEWRLLRPVLVEFFQEREGHWYHARAEKELESAGLRKTAAVAKAKAAAEARWSKTSEQSSEECLEHPPSTPQEPLEDSPPPPPMDSVPTASDEASGTGAAGAAPPAPPPPPRPKETDPEVILFNIGVPYLVNASVPEKHARSFLGGLRKVHGDAPLISALRDCMKAKPMAPLEWLAKALPPPASAGGQAALEARNAAAVAAVLEEDHAGE